MEGLKDHEVSLILYSDTASIEMEDIDAVKVAQKGKRVYIEIT